jgi:hypothetical protein
VEPQVEYISVDDLLLDVENPRLPEEGAPWNQKSIISYIGQKSGIEDLMSSIGRNGFFPGEALVVYQNTKDAIG